MKAVKTLDFVPTLLCTDHTYKILKCRNIVDKITALRVYCQKTINMSL